MKKLLSVFALIFALCLVTGCGDKEVEYKLGMGVVVSLDSTADTKGQIDATVVTVVTNAEGKIVKARLDAVQNKATIGEAIEITNLETKQELKERYGMAGKVDNNGDGIKLEWFEQALAYEKYLEGKTLADVKAFETQFVNNHYISTDEALLNAGCTIQVTDFNAATVLALEDAQAFTFKTSKEFTLGLAATSYDSGSTAATAEANGALQIYSDFAASVVVDGKIVASLNDAIQPKVTFDVEGKIVEKTFKNTKRVLKEEYGMAGKVDNNGDGIKLEWYIQSMAFSKYVVGKTAAEVAALETTLVNNHYISTDEALLNAGCTIQITGIQAVVAKSVNNAR